MPDLTFRRGAPPAPVKMACMYCGAHATHAREVRVRNPRLEAPELNGRVFDMARGDESGCLVLLTLPLLLFDLARRIAAEGKYRAALRDTPPLDPPDTLVTVTTCPRHRRYGRRFVVAAVVGFFVLACGWGAMFLPAVREPIGPPLWLSVSVLVATLAFPIVWLMAYLGDGPVRISRAGRDEVTLSEVRPAYFDAPG